jgi:hypothetical protein
MKETDSRKIVAECAARRQFCRAVFRFEYTPHPLLPLSTGDECFLAGDGSGLTLDGFVIRRFDDISSVNPISGPLAELAGAAGSYAPEELPPVDITDFGSAAASLFRMGKNVIIERCDASGDSRVVEILPCRIISCGPLGCVVLPFSTSAGWARSPVRISFPEILRISFGQSSLELFSKYLPPCPFV